MFIDRDRERERHRRDLERVRHHRVQDFERGHRLRLRLISRRATINRSKSSTHGREFADVDMVLAKCKRTSASITSSKKALILHLTRSRCSGTRLEATSHRARRYCTVSRCAQTLSYCSLAFGSARYLASWKRFHWKYSPSSMLAWLAPSFLP